MVIGVTALRVVPGKERSVYQALKCRKEIRDVYHVFGEYDFFVILQAEGENKLGHLVEGIGEIYDVTDAETILVGDADTVSAVKEGGG